MRKIYIFGAVALMFAACTPTVNITKAPTRGSADFTNYLAIGDNYSAGYADNSLTVTGQLNSLPQRLFEQFTLVGANGPFVQPLLKSDFGYPGPKKVLAIKYNFCKPWDSSMGPIDYPNFIMNPADKEPFISSVNNGQINNIATSGLRVVDFPVVSYAPVAEGNGSPYAIRFYHNSQYATPKDELRYRVGNLHPTFFTMWLGLNDLLGYAAKYGGQGNGTGNALPSTLNIYNQNDISNILAFRANYDSALSVATSEGAKGVLINIPDITELPFFNTIHANALKLERQSEVDSLQALYPSPVWNVVFQVGDNYFIIQDHGGNVRQAVPGEKILLTTPLDSLRCAGWGKTKPIPAQYVLTTDELQNIRNNRALMNSYIKQEAELYNLAYADIDAYLSTLSVGFHYYGVEYSTEYVKGGAYSLDGINFTQRGYALIANYILTVINARYGSNMPMVDVNKYHGIDFPNN